MGNNLKLQLISFLCVLLFLGCVNQEKDSHNKEDLINEENGSFRVNFELINRNSIYLFTEYNNDSSLFVLAKYNGLDIDTTLYIGHQKTKAFKRFVIFHLQPKLYKNSMITEDGASVNFRFKNHVIEREAVYKKLQNALSILPETKFYIDSLKGMNPFIEKLLK